MEEILSRISSSVTISAVNPIIPTRCDGSFTIKQELPEIDMSFEAEPTVSTGPEISPVIVGNDETHSYHKEVYNLKDCCIRLERCDKIWETLKVIKNLQLSDPSKQNDENYAAAFQDAMHNHSKNSTPEPMQYHPVLNNGNSALPNFQFAIKSWKRLYTCTYCGKQYTENRNLKNHLLKVHNVISAPKDVSRSKEILSTKEIPRPQDIPRPKEISRPKEVIRPKEIARPKEISQPKEVARPKDLIGKEDLSKLHVCKSCGVRYSDARSLAGHSLRVHGILTEFHERWLAQQENPNDYTVEDLLKRHPCTSCDKRYSCMKSLRVHYLREHNLVLPSMRGGRKTVTFNPLPVNTGTHSGDMQKHMNVCTICGKKYTKNWYLRVHCLEVHGIPMLCGKLKKNFTPKLRIVKKEIEEPECYPESDQKLSKEENINPQNENHVSPEKVNLTTITPPTRVLKMYQCTACRKEFISTTKLRNHAFARHGIIIPRLRKPYRKVNPSLFKTEMDDRMNQEVKTSTPKQVSLDRYFKTPPSGGNTFMKVNPILAPTQSPPKKDKIIKENAPAKEIIAPKESSPVKVPQQKEVPKVKTILIKCTLCARTCKDIRKHLMAYHKIRDPDSVMRETPFYPVESSEHEPPVLEKESQIEPDQEPKQRVIPNQPPKKRRRRCLTMKKKKKRRIEPLVPELQAPVLQASMPQASVPQAPVVKTPVMKAPVVQSPVLPAPMIQTPVLPAPVIPKPVQTPTNRNIVVKKTVSPKIGGLRPIESMLKCTICSGYYATPLSLKRHRQKHKLKGETKENIHLVKHNYKNMYKYLPRENKTDVPTFDESAMNLDLDDDIENESRTSGNGSISQSSSSDSRSSNRRSTRSTRNSYGVNETTCECGRSFRDPHTLFLHKEKCRTAHRIEREKMLLARSSSDRDSGIGISITIKKKNDSYEIVSRDSGDDDKSKDSSISKDSDQMSHSSDSNSSSSVFGNRKYTDLDPAQCSKDHSILKIQVI